MCRRAPTTPCWVHDQYSQNGNQQAIYRQSEDVNMQCNFKTAAFVQMGDAKWAVLPAREYPPKAKQVAAAITNKESTKHTAIMVPNRLVRLSFVHEVAAAQLAAGWVKRALVTPNIHESSGHLHSFAGSQYHQAFTNAPISPHRSIQQAIQACCSNHNTNIWLVNIHKIRYSSLL